MSAGIAPPPPPGAPVRSGSAATLAAMIVAAAVGVAIVLATLPLDFITGKAGYWSHPQREGIDGIAAITGLRYFLADGWRWPLLDIEGFGPGYAVSAVYTDSIPVLALALKLLGATEVNPYGWWVAASSILAPVAAVRVARALGARSLGATVAVATFAATMPILQLRLVHPALTAHWLFLVAVEAHLRRRDGQPLVAIEVILPALALGVHPYLLALCLGPLWSATAADARLARGGARVRSLAPAAAGACILAAFAAAIGLRAPPLGGMEREWGDYAMNLLSPVWPRFSALHSFPVEASSEPGQSDGRAWLGFGTLALLAAAALLLPGVRMGIRRHAPLAAVCLAYLAFAVTTRPALGDRRLLDWYPDVLSPLVETFRASGRFAWLPAWVAVLAAASLLARTARGTWLLILLAAVQVADTAPVRNEAARVAHSLREPTARRDAALEALSRVGRVEMWPPYDCIRSYLLHDAALDIVVMASELRVPIDSARAARPISDCPAAWRRAQEPGVPEGTLRLFLAEDWEIERLPAWTAKCAQIPAVAGVTIRACGDGR